MIINEFKNDNPDDPLPVATLHTSVCTISDEDEDISSGSGGINRGRYTYKKLRNSPIILELMEKVNNISLVPNWAHK